MKKNSQVFVLFMHIWWRIRVKNCCYGSGICTVYWMEIWFCTWLAVAWLWCTPQYAEFCKRPKKFYLNNSQLWEIDYSWEGFSWISNDDYTQSIISFRRTNKAGDEIVCVCNFVPVSRSDYRIGVPVAGKYKTLLTTDDEKYGGTGGVKTEYLSEKIPMMGMKTQYHLIYPRFR